MSYRNYNYQSNIITYIMSYLYIIIIIYISIARLMIYLLDSSTFSSYRIIIESASTIITSIY